MERGSVRCGPAQICPMTEVHVADVARPRVALHSLNEVVAIATASGEGERARGRVEGEVSSSLRAPHGRHAYPVDTVRLRIVESGGVDREVVFLMERFQ